MSTTQPICEPRATRQQNQIPNPEVLQKIHGQVFADCNAGIGTLLVFMGDKLGLFRTLDDQGPLTSQELAGHHHLNERMLREWLSAMTAAGYLTYDPAEQRFGMTAEQASVLAREGHPAFMQGPIDMIYGLFQDEPKLREAMSTGRGFAWGDHNPCLFCATNRFFGPLYRSSLLQQWLPAVEGLVDRLQRGIDVADVGCGHGTSTLLMAEAFPASRFIGFDNHAGSIDAARVAAREIGVSDRCRFEAATAKAFDGQYDLICFFDALHDMGDPVGAAVHAKSHLKPGGVLMLIEPYAEDTLEANLAGERALVSRYFYAASTLACVPTSQSQEVGTALGAQAGKRRLMAVLQEAGFDNVRIATATAANLVIEARA